MTATNRQPGQPPENNPYQPFAQRLAGVPLDRALHEGVPPHLDTPLRAWVNFVVTASLARRVCLKLKLPYASGPDLARGSDDETLLNAIDAVLHIGLEQVQAPVDTSSWAYAYRGIPNVTPEQQVDLLKTTLAEGDSAYRVNDAGDGLELRVDATVAEAARAAARAASKASRPEAADLLRDAWAKVYGINPDPGEGYADAVRAVEAVACPRFLPNDPEPTLGKVRAHLDQSRHLYEMVISDKQAAPASVDAVVEMVALLWHGQRERHAGGPSTAPISQEAAESAVQLAAVLVHWFSTGAVRRK